MTWPRREAGVMALAGAVIASLLDAFLLERQRGFFTGGFLATDVAATWADRLVFAAMSVLTDLPVAACGAVAALALSAAVGLGMPARRLLTAALAVGPLSLASVVQYEVLSRLGDAFDAGLMFDLVGRRAGELLAVTSAQLALPAVSAVLGVLGIAVTLRAVNRRWPDGVRPAPPWRVWGWLGAGAGIVAALTTGVRVYSDIQDNGLRRKPAGQWLGTLVERVSDVDRDGYGVLGRPGDPAPFDARVYPYAIDEPGNGIDEDGIGGDLPLAAPKMSSAAPVAPFSHRPSVLLIMLETFRADLLGAREGGHPITPVLDALAREGAAARHALSHNGYTVQSRFHLFTGRLTGPHGGTLLDDFRSNGYEVAYFSAQDESFGGPAFDIGAELADTFYDARQDRARRSTTFTTAGSLGVPADVLIERLDAFLSARDTARPLFLYVNLYDTHYPYWHSGLRPLVSNERVSQVDIRAENAERVRLMYRNAAANVDAAVGRVRALVGEHVRGVPATIVLADHGESLFDSGFLGHGYVLDDWQTRVPLVAAGIGLDMCEPVAQRDLRQAIGRALRSNPAASPTPTFRSCPDKQVFQYLGTVARPRQIATVSATGRLVFDLRESAVRVPGGAWVHPDRLQPPEREAWLALVHQWERARWEASRP